MKRLIYALLALMVVLSSTGLAKKVKFSINNNPFSNQTINMQKVVLPNGSLEYRIANPSDDYTVSHSPMPPAILYQPEDQVGCIYSTRVHPFFPQGQLDTARVLVSHVNPSDTMYIGDMWSPTRVNGQNGTEVFKINGYAQFCPSLKYYFPQFVGGTFNIDTVSFFLYPYPNSPVKQSFYLGIFEVPGTNMGTNQFHGISMNLNDVMDSLPDVYEMRPDSINAHITLQGGGYFTIRAWNVTFNTQSLQQMATIDNSNNAFCFIIFKSDNQNLTDTTGLIGAWEWTVPNYNYTFGSVICHYPNNSDSVRTLFTTLAPWNPKTPTDFPQWTSQQYFKQDFDFIITGTYNGPVNAVKESDDASIYSLDICYPNPVQDKATIKFSIKQSNQVNIKVYNTIGQLVSELVNDELAPGTYTTTFDASGLPNGSYIYTMQAGTYVVSKVLTVIK
jgi:hypothetical protein